MDTEMNVKTASNQLTKRSEQAPKQSMTEQISKSSNQKIDAPANQSSMTNVDAMSHTIDKATGLVQTIRMDGTSEEVIRKMPADEYLRLLSLLDEVTSGSIDKKI